MMRIGGSTLVLVLLCAACGSGSGGGGGQDGGADGAASGDGGGTSSGTTCRQACEKVEQACPTTWKTIAECEERCKTEPFTQASLDCVVNAIDCKGVDVCSN